MTFLQNENQQLNSKVLMLQNAIGMMFMHGSNITRTLIESGNVDWIFFYQLSGLDITQTSTYRLESATDGFLNFYIITFNPPPNPYTVPSVGCDGFRIDLDNFVANSQVPRVDILVAEPNRAKISLPCYQAGTCTFGPFSASRNVITPAFKTSVGFQISFYSSDGSFDCAQTQGQTFSLTSPWEFVIQAN